MAKIWVVFGETGEYEDRRDWSVKAFASKRRAYALVKRLEKKLQDLEISAYRCNEDQEEAMRKVDPGFTCSFPGVEYGAYSLDFDPTKGSAHD